MIYREALVQTTEERHLLADAGQPPLTRVNSVTRNESLPVYYGENVFSLLVLGANMYTTALEILCCLWMMAINTPGTSVLGLIPNINIQVWRSRPPRLHKGCNWYIRMSAKKAKSLAPPALDWHEVGDDGLDWTDQKAVLDGYIPCGNGGTEWYKGFRARKRLSYLHQHISGGSFLGTAKRRNK